MHFLPILTEAGYWLTLLLNSAALCAVLLWPRAKGKAWLVAFLSITVFAELYFRVLYVLVHWFSVEPRYRLFDDFQTIHFLVQFSVPIATACLVVGVLRMRPSVGAAPLATTFPATSDPSGLPDIRLLPETHPDTRARILLRLGGRSESVVRALQAIGTSEAESQSIVAAQLDSLRSKAGILLGCGVILSLCALVANIISFGQYMQLQRSYGYHLVFFYPLPLLIGVVIACTGIARLSRLR